jgi:hypothetical protein
VLKINGSDIAVHPAQFAVNVLDLDDAEASVRTSDGTATRDRIAVKRKVEMSWGLLTWPQISSILTALQNPFVKFTYPDPMSGRMETKTFYTGDRSAAVAVTKGSEILWSGLKFNLTEQ